LLIGRLFSFLLGAEYGKYIDGHYHRHDAAHKELGSHILRCAIERATGSFFILFARQRVPSSTDTRILHRFNCCVRSFMLFFALIIFVFSLLPKTFSSLFSDAKVLLFSNLRKDNESEIMVFCSEFFRGFLHSEYFSYFCKSFNELYDNAKER